MQVGTTGGRAVPAWRAPRGASPAEDAAKSAECLIAFTAVTATQLGETQAQRQEALSLEAVVKLSLSLSLSSSSMKECVCVAAGQ